MVKEQFYDIVCIWLITSSFIF